MPSTKTSGIWTDEHGNKTIDKTVGGFRIFKRLGAVTHQLAESLLARAVETRRLSRERGTRPEVAFADAAARYLREAQGKLRSIEVSAWHIELLAPFIGNLPLNEVHDGTLEAFVKHRLEHDHVSLTTVNRSLEIARRVLNLAARKYRHQNGMTWLESAPLITIDGKTARRDARKPYPLSWEEQDLLFAQLPVHLHQMALFKVNTGTREQEVCRLRWKWEVRVPELNTSVFIVPGAFVKNGEDRLVVLNQVAMGVIEKRRGVHEEFVFTWRRPLKKPLDIDRRPGKPLDCMNNTAWQSARQRAAAEYGKKLGEEAPVGFAHVRVHDLKHTFGRRLRAAGVAAETRKVLLGHTNGDITTHYSTAELAELVAAVNKVDRSTATPAITLLRSAA
jgi:integrase